MPIVLNGLTSGSTTIQATDAVTQTITLPNNSGTVLTTASTGVVTQAMLSTNVAGNGPAFSAYSTSNQSISQNVATKVAFQATEFDTANAFDKTTNYRFQPLVAGYYQINGYITFTTAQGTTETVVDIYKNGSAFKQVADANASAFSYGGSALIYLNGSTDYLELWAYSNNSGTRTINANVVYTYFQASMVRTS